MKTYGLELVRSDCGDGGWSLHDPAAEDEDGVSPVLLSGEAEWVEHDDQSEWADDGWNRPNQADYDAANAARNA